MSIAVIIPAYNAAAYLQATLESALAQTVRPDEILVVDDGSTDATAAIAESFGPPVRVFRRANARQGASRNFAAQQAQSEWLAFLDADDLWHPEKLARQLAALAAQPAADLCYSGRVHFTEGPDGLRYGRVFPAPPPPAMRHTLFEGDLFLPSSMLVRRAAFLDVGGFATHFTICEDWHFLLRLFHRGSPAVACPEPLHLYRVHGTNVSARLLVLLEEQTAIFYQLILPFYPAHLRWLAWARFFSRRTGEVAYGLRASQQTGYTAMMARSLLFWPFNDLPRYKVFAHMLLSSVHLVRPRGGSRAQAR